jgi:hypothetical protein
MENFLRIGGARLYVNVTPNMRGFHAQSLKEASGVAGSRIPSLKRAVRQALQEVK